MIKTTKFVRNEDFSDGGKLKRNWKLVDAEGKTLGRICTEIAVILRGKNKPFFTPHVDCGDFVIVVNADKVHLTGNKWKQKVYYRHSLYIGGLKQITAEKQLEKDSTMLIFNAVKGMLPKSILGRETIKKLKIYPGPDHPHRSQNPVPIEFK